MLYFNIKKNCSLRLTFELQKKLFSLYTPTRRDASAQKGRFEGSDNRLPPFVLPYILKGMFAHYQGFILQSDRFG